MKKYLVLILLIFSITCSQAQVFYANEQHELCIKLHNQDSTISSYNIYVIANSLSEADSLLIKAWPRLSADIKMKVIDKWNNTGNPVIVDMSELTFTTKRYCFKYKRVI